MFRYYNAAANVETPHRPSTINQHVHALSFDFRLSVHTASFCCANCVSHMVRVFIVGLPFCGILLQLLAQIPPDPLCVFVLPIAMPLFTVLLLHCGFEEWLPTATFLQLLATCSLDSSLRTTLQWLRSLSLSFNSLVDASAPALLQGVFCLGLQGQVAGTLLVERSVPATFLNDVCDRLGFSLHDERDLGPVIQQVAPGADAFAAWCCVNHDTPVWLLLQLFLQTLDPHSHVSYHWLQRPTQAAFLVVLQLGNLRAALVFCQHHIVISDSD